MRRFDDHERQTWEVVAGRESWGALVAIFIPVEGVGGEGVEGVEGGGDAGARGGLAMRQAPLSAASYEAASAEFDRLGDEGLRDLLLRSEPKTF